MTSPSVSVYKVTEIWELGNLRCMSLTRSVRVSELVWWRAKTANAMYVFHGARGPERSEVHPKLFNTHGGCRVDAIPEQLKAVPVTIERVRSKAFTVSHGNAWSENSSPQTEEYGLYKYNKQLERKRKR